MEKSEKQSVIDEILLKGIRPRYLMDYLKRGLIVRTGPGLMDWLWNIEKLGYYTTEDLIEINQQLDKEENEE